MSTFCVDWSFPIAPGPGAELSSAAVDPELLWWSECLVV